MKDNYDKLQAMNTKECVQYVPTSKCSKDPSIIGISGDRGPYLHTDTANGPCKKGCCDKGGALLTAEEQLEIQRDQSISLSQKK